MTYKSLPKQKIVKSSTNNDFITNNKKKISRALFLFENISSKINHSKVCFHISFSSSTYIFILDDFILLAVSHTAATEDVSLEHVAQVTRRAQTFRCIFVHSANIC